MGIKIKSVIIKNFLSIRELVLEIPDRGLIQLVGENGSGKTSILEAIMWCMYGSIRIERNISSFWVKSDRETVVTLTFEFDNDHYVFERTRNGQPVVSLIKNNVDITNPEAKNFFSTYCTFDLFRVLCFPKRFFLELSATEQQRLLEQISDISVVNKCLINIRERLRKNAIVIDNEKTTINQLTKQNLDISVSLENTLREHIDIHSFEEILLALEPIIYSLDYDVKLLQKLRYGPCPVCGSPPNVNDVERREKELPEKQKQLQEYERDRQQIKEKIRLANENNLTIAREAFARELLLRNQQQLITINENLSQLYRQESLLQYWHNAIDQQIRPQILSNTLGIICDTLNTWSTTTQLFATINEDTFQFTRGNNSFDYENLSLGERRRIDLVLLYSLRMLYPTLNILFLDEVLDMLDIEGKQFALELLQQFCITYGCVTFYTSHSTEMSQIGTIITVSKHNEETHIG